VVKTRQAARIWGLDDLGRPEVCRSDPLVETGAGTGTVAGTGLVWEQAGSAYPLNWRDAQERIQGLNKARFAGQSHWRLPALEEILGLVRPPAQGQDLCLPPVFDSRQKWLWSCDRRSRMTAWFVSMDLGYVGWQDMDCRCHVRAVCDNRKG
jgi:serine/threonine-protein kinase